MNDDERLAEIRASISKKLCDLGKDENGNFLSGTFTMHGVLTPLEQAVHDSDMMKITRMLDAHLCPNHPGEIIRLVRTHRGIPFFGGGSMKCPKCGFTVDGV